jgi:hypothetical protein
VTIRGLNKDHNHDLKGLFKAAATRASVQPGPFQDFSREKNVLDILLIDQAWVLKKSLRLAGEI